MFGNSNVGKSTLLNQFLLLTLERNDRYQQTAGDSYVFEAEENISVREALRKKEDMSRGFVSDSFFLFSVRICIYICLCICLNSFFLFVSFSFPHHFFVHSWLSSHPSCHPFPSPNERTKEKMPKIAKKLEEALVFLNNKFGIGNELEIKEKSEVCVCVCVYECVCVGV